MVGADLIQIAPGHGARPHDEHMLEVVALLAVMPQEIAQKKALGSQERGVQQEEKDQRPAGEVDLLEHEEKGLQKGHIQHIGGAEPAQLLIEPFFAEGFIKAEGGICEEMDGDQGEAQIDIVGKGDGDFAAGQQKKAYPEGQKEGEKNRHPICDHIELIQQPLIFLDHGFLPHSPVFYSILSRMARYVNESTQLPAIVGTQRRGPF